MITDEPEHDRHTPTFRMLDLSPSWPGLSGKSSLLDLPHLIARTSGKSEVRCPYTAALCVRSKKDVDAGYKSDKSGHDEL